MWVKGLIVLWHRRLIYNINNNNNNNNNNNHSNNNNNKNNNNNSNNNNNNNNDNTYVINIAASSNIFFKQPTWNINTYQCISFDNTFALLGIKHF